MSRKILNFLLFLTSLLGYLQWGKDNSAFLFQAEAEVFRKLVAEPLSVLHPFTVLPVAGQLLLLITLFQNQPSKALTLIGLAMLSLLMLLVFLIGILSGNWLIAGSATPFLVVGAISVWRYRRFPRGA